jgi:5-methyltetrahydropteroyltriglutamate--homocysteine methyltransferase
VNPRTEKVESPEEITQSIEQAMKLYPRDKLFLNPDCGFGTFSNRPVNKSDIAFQKLKAIVSAARTLR